MSDNRELRAEIDISSTPDQVWAVVGDVGRMGELSDETIRMIPMLRGGMRVGQQYLGINRRKGVIWPSRSTVTAYDAPRRISWLTNTSGAEWIFELSESTDGTHVVHRRPAIRLTRIGKAFATVALGGREEHADELEEGMGHTLARLKAAVERSR